MFRFWRAQPIGNYFEAGSRFLCNVKYFFSFDLGAQRTFPCSFWGVAHYLWKVRDDGAKRGPEELIIDCPRLVFPSRQKSFVKQ